MAKENQLAESIDLLEKMYVTFCKLTDKLSQTFGIKHIALTVTYSWKPMFWPFLY